MKEAKQKSHIFVRMVHVHDLSTKGKCVDSKQNAGSLGLVVGAETECTWWALGIFFR